VVGCAQPIIRLEFDCNVEVFVDRGVAVVADHGDQSFVVAADALEFARDRADRAVDSAVRVIRGFAERVVVVTVPIDARQNGEAHGGGGAH
jgi:hypothetical protein